MTITLPHGIMVTATTRADEDKKLNAAIAELQHLAFAKPTRGGILVTRLGSGQFDVRLSAEVPYGLTGIDAAVATSGRLEPEYRVSA